MEQSSPHYVGFIVGSAGLLVFTLFFLFRRSLFNEAKTRIALFLLVSFSVVAAILGNGSYRVVETGSLTLPEGKWTEKHLQSALAAAFSREFMDYYDRRHGSRLHADADELRALIQVTIHSKEQAVRRRGTPITIRWEIQCEQIAFTALVVKSNCTPENVNLVFLRNLARKYLDELYWIEYYRASTSSEDAIRALKDIPFQKPDAMTWVLPFMRRFRDNAENIAQRKLLSRAIADMQK